MSSEPEEAEVSAVSAAQRQSADDADEAGTLVELTFQKNPTQKYKYLEAEPTILGVTEIALTVFFVVCRLTFYNGTSGWILNSVMLVFSCVGIISGNVAIAAQKLHLPTLKACLGMQIVTCMAYSFCFLGTIVLRHSDITGCWHFYNDSKMAYEIDACTPLEKGISQLYSLDQLMEATQIVLSITLAAYCCKVIPCCSPISHVPVIMMPPTTPQ